MNNWQEYQAEGDSGEYVSIEKWGKDHWSTFAYLETRTVDDHGLIDNRRMRCNARLHRHFANVGLTGVIDGSNYPTILKDGQLENHDDWSCLEDMVKAGLILAWFRMAKSGEAFGGSVAKIELTQQGRVIANRLREHKANGGKYGNFQLL